MTFSFIDVKVPGKTSQNNEPQKLEEALEPNAMAKAANDAAKKAAKKRKEAMAKAGYKMETNEAMDPVDKKAVKKKFDDRKDKDIDNDGDVDSSDKFLHKRRKAISKATSKPTEDEPEGENGETAEMNPKMKDKKKMEKKESKIREALLSIFERGRLDNKDDYDEKFRGKGAKDMKKDHMKGEVDDTLKLAVKDVSDAGRRGPSPKARSGADKMNVGDKKIMKGGTPTPNQKMESLVQAYKSMKSI